MSTYTELIKGVKLTQEESVIINCLRLEFGRENKNELAKFDLSTINWDMVYKKSTLLGVTPLLYRIIKRQPALTQFSGISEQFLQKIRMEYLRTSIVNDIRFKKLAELIEIFNKAGIEVILLKGSHLAQFVYKDIGVRPMSDIDILIKEKDIAKVEGLLLQMGYKYPKLDEISYHSKGFSNDALGQAKLIEWYKANHTHLHPFTNPKGINCLEVYHRTIIPPSLPFKIEKEGLWERAAEMKINSTKVLTLSREDTLLHISLDTFYTDDRYGCSLKAYCDIATIITHCNNEIDWNQLQLRAYEWGVEKCIYLALRLTEEIFGLSLTDNILQAIKPKQFNEKFILEAKMRILSPGNKQPSVNIFNYPENFLSNTSLSKKISYLLGRIFPPREELAFQYSLPTSSERIYFYYIIRLSSILNRKIPLYARFFLYLLFHKKTDYYNYNLDTWLIPTDSRK